MQGISQILGFGLLLAIMSQCAVDQTFAPFTESASETLAYFQSLDERSQLMIADQSEPGDRLWLCLTVVTKEDKGPLVNEKIKLYHTASNGEYQPTDPNDESTARLNGTVTTDDRGRALIQTTMPGSYGSSANNRHIHTTVESADPVAYDMHFKQYTGRMGRKFINGSDQHFLADLMDVGDAFVTFVTIEVKNYDGG